MKNLTSEQRLNDKVGQLSKEMEPKRDLWPGIEKAIATTPQQTQTINVKEPRRDLWSGIESVITTTPHQSVPTKVKMVPLAWAASVVAAVLLSWFTFSPQGAKTQLPVNLASIMNEDFEEQKQLVLASFGQPELKKLPPEMQNQLSELSAARGAIVKALENDPTNSELLNLLRWTQKQEIDLLKQLYSPQWQTI